LEKLTEEELEKNIDLSKEEKDIINIFLTQEGTKENKRENENNIGIKRANKIQDVLFNDPRPSLQVSVKTQNLLNSDNNDSAKKTLNAINAKTTIKKKTKKQYRSGTKA